MNLHHLAPYVPGQDGPWDGQAAAHLLRRAGFGAAPAQVKSTVEAGLDAAVEDLFHEKPETEAEYQQTFSRICDNFVDFSDPSQLQAWWCYRMRTSPTPLREKLTLFWHGHFATSIQKVGDSYLMHQQIETLRRHAWGHVRELVLAVARDPSMLVYLDGESSTKENPNENFARELMELFTIGIGHYTETDVREAARAFTGWHRDGAKFQFNKDAHDDGKKTFLGRKGKFDGTDVIDVLMQAPATPRFLARKLLVFFACPEPAAAVVDEAAQLFARSGMNVKWFLRDLFQSKFFYGADCRRTRISSPAEFVIGACRSLGARVAAAQLVGHLTAMGQDLFSPPNVKGWDGEKKWINSSTWAARLAFAQEFADYASDTGFGALLHVDQLVAHDHGNPERVANDLVERLLGEALPAAKRGELAQFLVTADDGDKREQFKTDADFRRQQIRALVGLLLSLPEYHAC